MKRFTVLNFLSLSKAEKQASGVIQKYQGNNTGDAIFDSPSGFRFLSSAPRLWKRVAITGGLSKTISRPCMSIERLFTPLPALPCTSEEPMDFTTAYQRNLAAVQRTFAYRVDRYLALCDLVIDALANFCYYQLRNPQDNAGHNTITLYFKHLKRKAVRR